MLTSLCIFLRYPNYTTGLLFCQDTILTFVGKYSIIEIQSQTERGISMTIAEKIRKLRKQAGLTQTELGEKLGVKKNAVSKWECGRVEDIPAGKIKAMARIFDVQPSYLIDDAADVPAVPAVPSPGPDDEALKFALFGGDGEITDEMFEEVRQFAAFVKARKKQP